MTAATTACLVLAGCSGPGPAAAPPTGTSTGTSTGTPGTPGADGGAAAAATADGTPQGREASPAPFAGGRLYVDPGSNAARAVRDADPATAERIRVLAETPSAVWLGSEADPYLRAQEVTEAAERHGSVPVLVVYTIPGRDCGLYSSGGSSGAEEYLSWVGGFAAGLEGREAIIVLEPDAVAHSVVGCPTADAASRQALLASAVDVLQEEPGAHVYIDAGNSSWVQDLPALADALRASGVENADGFALNVSNFEPTDATVAYGTELSALLDGKPFVVDVSRNGAGAPAGDDRPDGAWCNPMDARVGQQPTLDPGIPYVDALLWVKHPGDSDGDCSPGAPPAGVWWPELADSLVSDLS